MYLLYTIVTISYPSKLHGGGGTITFPVLTGGRGSGFGSKINEVSVQRERKKKGKGIFFFLPKGRERLRNKKMMAESVGGVISAPLSCFGKAARACSSPAHLLASSFVRIWGCAVRSPDAIRAGLPLSLPSPRLPSFLPLLLSRAPSVCHLLFEILKIRLPVSQTRSHPMELIL